MSNVIQEIANWVLGSYKVRAKEVDGGLIQEVAIVDASGNQVTSFGGSFSATKLSSVGSEAVVAVTTSSTAVVASNASRTAGWVKNISDETIYVSLSGTAATNKPTKLSPGESLSFGSGVWCYTGAVSAIHGGSGSKNLEVVEL